MSTPFLSHTSPLKPLLYDLVYRAQKSPGIPQRVEFDNGLLVEVLYHDERVILQISRRENFPTLSEYEDLLTGWPYQMGHHRPQAVAHSGRKYLTSMWPKLNMPSF